MNDLLGATQVTMLEKLRSNDPDVRRKAFERFVIQYLDGISAYVKACYRGADADDITNDFFAYKMEPVVNNWSPDRPFRPYLKTCLRRMRTGKKQPIPAENIETAETHGFDAIDVGETVAWLEESRQRMHEYCQTKPETWGKVFHHYFEKVLWEGATPPSYRELATLCGLAGDGNKSIDGYVARVKSLFFTTIKQVIEEYTGDTEEACQEQVRLLTETRMGLHILSALQGQHRDENDHQLADNSPSSDVNMLTTYLSSQANWSEVDPAEVADAVQFVLNVSFTKGSQATTVGEFLSNGASAHLPDMESARNAIGPLMRRAKLNGNVALETAVGMVDFALLSTALTTHGLWASSRKPTDVLDGLVAAVNAEWLSDDLRTIMRQAIDVIRKRR
ncbi:MAG: hypothetical protein R3C28_28720 [Pirellulaceae bacterium]